MTLNDDLTRFSSIPVSHISAHGDDCCRATRLRLMTLLDSGPVETSLAAIPGLVRWTAVSWPVHWCDLAGNDDQFDGDCGVHAALAALVLQRHGVQFGRAQIAIAATDRHMDHWRRRWMDATIEPAWIGQVAVYHEVISIGSRLWDPSEARWFDGNGSDLLAGRVVAHRVFGGQWHTAPTASPAAGTEPPGFVG